MSETQEYKKLAQQLASALDGKSRIFDVIDLVSQLIVAWHLLPDHSIYKTRSDIERLVQLQVDLENKIN